MEGRGIGLLAFQEQEVLEADLIPQHSLSMLWEALAFCCVSLGNSVLYSRYIEIVTGDSQSIFKIRERGSEGHARETKCCFLEGDGSDEDSSPRLCSVAALCASVLTSTQSFL